MSRVVRVLRTLVEFRGGRVFFLFLAPGFVGLGSGVCASVLEMSGVLRERFQFIHSFIQTHSRCAKAAHSLSPDEDPQAIVA